MLASHFVLAFDSLLIVPVLSSPGYHAVPPPVGCWPLACRPPTLDGAAMLAIGAGGGRAGSIVPPPGARGQPWRSKQRGRAPGRHLMLGGTIFAQRFGKERFPEYNKTTFPCLGAWRQRSALPLHQGKQWTSCLYSTCKFGSIEQC